MFRPSQVKQKTQYKDVQWIQGNKNYTGNHQAQSVETNKVRELNLVTPLKNRDGFQQYSIAKFKY